MPISIIKIKMHVGVLRTLKSVRHVLNLKRNLRSLGEMDSSGYKASVKNESMRILRGAQIALKVRKVGNFYVLSKNTIQGEAVVSFTPYSGLLCIQS